MLWVVLLVLSHPAHHKRPRHLDSPDPEAVFSIDLENQILEETSNLIRHHRHHSVVDVHGYGHAVMDLEVIDKAYLTSAATNVRKHCKQLRRYGCPKATDSAAIDSANAGSVKAALRTIAKALRKTIDTAFSEEIPKPQSMLSEVMVLDLFHEFANGPVAAGDAAWNLECSCSPADLTNAHHPVYARSFYESQGKTPEERRTRALEEGWKINVYFTCCVSDSGLVGIVNGLFGEPASEFKMCSCEEDVAKVTKEEKDLKTGDEDTHDGVKKGKAKVTEVTEVTDAKVAKVAKVATEAKEEESNAGGAVVVKELTVDGTSQDIEDDGSQT